MKIQVINFGLSIAALCILLIDFFVVDEFSIERGYLDVFVSLLIINIIRIIFENKIRILSIGMIVNLGLLGFLIFNLWVFAILALGVGFTGRSFPLILLLAIFVNFLFTVTSFAELIKSGIEMLKLAKPKLK